MDKKSKLTVIKGEGGRGVKGWTGGLGLAYAHCGIWNDCPNGDLLYTTGYSTQYSVIIYMGKESEGEWMWVFV